MEAEVEQLPEGDDLVREIREKYFKIKLKHDILKKKYEEIRREYCDVRKELDIVLEELDKHESGIIQRKNSAVLCHIRNGVKPNSLPNDDLEKHTFNNVLIKREVNENEETAYSSDERHYIMTLNPNISCDDISNEFGDTVVKVNVNGRLKKRSRDFYKRHNEFMQNSCHKDLANDHQVSPYPNISPVQCYYSGDNPKSEIIDGDVIGEDSWALGSCGLTHTPDSFKDCKICSVDTQSDDNIPHSLLHLYGDLSSTPGTWRKRKKLSTQPYKCEICGNYFAGTYNYNRHKLIHTGEKPFKCDLCDKTFNRKDKYKVHIRSHHETTNLNNYLNDQSVQPDNSVTIDPSLIKIEPVDEMSAAIINGSLLPSVKTGKKKINNITFECDICYKKVQGSLSLIRHKERHAAKKPKECDVCGKVFIKTYSFNRHRMLHTGEKPFICNLCGEGFSRNDKLLVHTRKHKRYSPDKMKFKCDVCDLFFSESEHVTKHQSMHNGEEWFTCDICFKSFKLELDLIVHRRSRHIIRDETKKRNDSFSQLIETYAKSKVPYISKKQHKCNDCGKGFADRFRLARHKRAHTSGKSHKCLECGKEFLEKFVLNRHEKTHSKDKPHKCEVCGKNFLEKSKLMRHKKIHDNVRPFQCGDCGKAFIEKHRLVNHQRIHATTKCNLCDEYFTDPDAYRDHQLLHNEDKLIFT
ncbi:zinc finger protein 708 [Biomphalaria glabrata]|nr:zinc finger protein 708 [Biomphalaria glabrata]